LGRSNRGKARTTNFAVQHVFVESEILLGGNRNALSIGQFPAVSRASLRDSGSSECHTPCGAHNILR
ncbi:hypothetical protein PMAYCL1PPCAC_22118, partial [Pristionchus mayeri]